jgi:hypothetical protein
MALAYVTLAEAKAHCRVDFSDDDGQFALFIYAASAAVKNYLKNGSAYEPIRNDDDYPELDSDGWPEVFLDSDLDKTVRYEVKAAVLILIGEWYKNREAEQGGDIGHGYLPGPVVNLLYPLRDPAFK